MRNIELEQKERKKRIEELQDCIKNKEESVQRRIERQKRNQDIAEAAANENKDSSELKMRESLYIQRLWNAFMRKKMEKEMKESQSIDEAFKAIKTATGVTDVQEMVRKFLTREQTYSQLLMNVSESERHIDKLKKDNEELRGRLHELKIDAGESGANAGAGSMMMDEEIIELNNNLAAVQKDYSLLQEKFKKINIVNDQVSGWAKKCFAKFSTLIGAGAAGEQSAAQSDMVTLFRGMNKVVTGELERIVEKQKLNDGEDVNMNFGEVFDDFEHKDFTAKNVRVRPISGFTHGDETRDGRQSNISKGNTEGNDDGEGKKEINFYCVYQTTTTSWPSSNWKIKERQLRLNTEKRLRKLEGSRLRLLRRLRPRKPNNDGVISLLSSLKLHSLLIRLYVQDYYINPSLNLSLS